MDGNLTIFQNEEFKVKDPVCGMQFAREQAAGALEYQGQTFYFCNQSCLERFRSDPARYLARDSQVKDPVCGMQFAPEKAAGTLDYQGQTYYFCNKSCFEKFRSDPARYLDSTKTTSSSRPQSGYTCPMDPEVSQSAPGACPKCGMALEPLMPAAESGMEYVCPMHPEIVQSTPSACPKCGMALESRFAGTQEQENPELAVMMRRFRISLILTLPILLIAMGEMLSSSQFKLGVWPLPLFCGADGPFFSGVGFPWSTGA
jgi:Cu+-exporting ATPase